MAIYTPAAGTDTRTDHLVDFTTKEKAPFIVTNAARIIEQLVSKQDPELERSLRYYNGERDPRKFEMLQDNYGVGNPNKIPFVSLMQRHIKALMGYFLELPFPVTVQAIDRDSIWAAREELAAQVLGGVMQQVNQMAQQQWGGAQPQGGPVQANAQAMQDVRKQAETFTSELERFTSVLLDSLVERLELKHKATSLVEARASTGRMFTRCWLEEEDQLPRFEDVPAGELHYVRNKKLGDLRGHKRVVRHRKMMRSEVLTRWGYDMSDEEKQLVGGEKAGDLGALAWVPLRMGQERGAPVGRDQQGNPSGVQETGNYLDSIAVREYGLQGTSLQELVDVYEVEFISPSPTDEDDEDSHDLEGTPFELVGTGTTLSLASPKKKKAVRQKEHVYTTVRIGNCLYVATGRYRYPERPVDNPHGAYLTYNGIFGERNMILDTEDLQDKYDLLSYHEDNLIALGGVPGIVFDVNDIPTYLGKTMPERVAKFKAHLKQGLAMVDRNQLGRKGGGGGPDPSAFNNTGKVDTSFNGQSIQAIRETRAYIEEQATKISGVPRQMQGEIQARDGLGTTKQAIDSGSAVNRPLFAQVFRLLGQGMTSMLNLCRVTAQHNPELMAALIGTRGSRVIGFGARRFPLANFNVHIKDSFEEKDTLERVRQAGQQLVAAMVVDPRLVIDIASINNVAVLRRDLDTAVEQFKQDQTAQLQQENQQLQQQLKQFQSDDQQRQQAELQLAERKVEVEAQLGQGQLQLQSQELAESSRHDQAMEELETQRVQLEGEQLFFNRQSAEVADK